MTSAAPGDSSETTSLIDGLDEDMDASDAQGIADASSSSAPSGATLSHGFKLKCKRPPGRAGNIAQCTRDDFEAKDLTEWCQKSTEGNVLLKYSPFTSAPILQLLANSLISLCEKFVESDETSKAYDLWYNTLERNYAKQRKADNPDSQVMYQTINTLDTGATLNNGGEVELEKMTGLAPTVLIENGKELPATGNTYSE